MHNRRDEYGSCTRALVNDQQRDGAAGIFDTALANGLAALVAARWPGEETTASGFVKSASRLLDVVVANVDARADGIYELEDTNPPPEVDLFDDLMQSTPTCIDVEVLCEGIKRTQVIRHAREAEAPPLEKQHVDALVALNDDAALRCSLVYVEDADEHEERVALADAIERARARAYFDLLSVDEWERRAQIDYEEEYVEIEDGERYHTAHECPVCGLGSLIEGMRDSYVDEYPAGTCAACSYVKSVEAADLEGRDEAIRRAVDDPNR